MLLESRTPRRGNDVRPRKRHWVRGEVTPAFISHPAGLGMGG